MNYAAWCHSWPLFRELRFPCGRIGLTQENTEGSKHLRGRSSAAWCRGCSCSNAGYVLFKESQNRTTPPWPNQTLRHLKCIGLSVPSLFWNCTICLMLHWDSHQVFISVVSESLGYSIGVKSTFCPFIKKLFCFAHSAVFCSYSYFLVVSCYYWGFDCSHMLCCFLCNSHKISCNFYEFSHFIWAFFWFFALVYLHFFQLLNKISLYSASNYLSQAFGGTNSQHIGWKCWLGCWNSCCAGATGYLCCDH